ncbi:MAG: autotransporter-associated beta strand repeat-containing protein [Thermoguttaceae bacterium]|jgi:autotransporter-associated beta strand protein|nr:autotransporter-associated beta strand repeat-containing protein [Thermoguttaceae bacterium]
MERAYVTCILCRFASVFKAASLLLLAWVAIPGPLDAVEPFFRFDDLLGTVTDGTRVRVVNSSSVTHMDVAEQVLLNGSLPGSARGLFPVVNFSNGGSFEDFASYPAGAAGDHFAFEASGLLHIPAAGSYVLGVNSDDGFRLRLGTGFDLVSQFAGPTGNSNTRVVVTFDQPGLVPYRLTHFEQSGGEFIEFYARPGTDTSFTTGDPGDYRLIGDTAGGGLQTIAAGQFYVRDVRSPVTVNELATIDAMLRGDITPLSQSTAFADFIDYGSGGRFNNNIPFPGSTAGDDDDFGIEATAMVFIPEAGTYTFGNNSDDGARVQVQGVRVINADQPQGTTDAFGTITFDRPGFYDLRYLYFERAGGASAELFVAKGTHTSWNAGAFRLMGDVANGGLAVFSPKGWQADASGNWDDAGNWRDGQVAGGAGAFATFSLVDLSADRTVTIDSTPTIGHVRFGDVDATGGPHHWTLAGSGALNLANTDGQPIIDVVNGRTNIGVPLTGNDGLAKQGAGTLVLQTPAGYSGPTTIREGTVELATPNALPTGTELTLGAGETGGTLALMGHNQQVAGLRTGGTASAANQVVGGSATPATLTVDVVAGRFDRFDGTLGGPGANDDNFSLVKQGPGTLQLTQASSYTGDTVVTGGVLQLGLAPGVDGAALWLDASSNGLITGDGGTVQQWLDQSGNNRHAVAAGLTSPLATTNALVHEMGVVRFDGTDQILGVDLSFLANSEYTIFAVEGRTIGGSGSRYYLGTTPGSTNRGMHIGYRGDTQYTLAQYGNDLTVTVDAYTAQDFKVWTNMLDLGAEQQAIYRNGALLGTRTTNLPFSTADNGRIGSGYGTEWFHGDLGEILIYNRALSATERQQVESYLMSRWLQGDFPTSNILPTDTKLRIGADGVLDLNSISQTVASLADYSGAGGTLRNLSAAPATFTTGGGNGDNYFSGSILDQPPGRLSFTKEGTGTQTLAGGGIQYRGDTIVSGGRLVFEDAVNFGNNQPGPTAMTLSNNAAVEFHVGDGNRQNVGLAGQVTIGGEGSVVKSGGGVLALGGQHTYSGDTIVTGGTLQLGASPGVEGAALWLDANSGSLVTSGGLVGQWLDQSGNDRHARAAGLTKPAAATNSLVNDMGVVAFDGTDQRLNVDLSFLGGSDYTIFAVEGRTAGGNRYYLGTYAASSANNALHVGYRTDTQYTLAQYSNDLNVTVPEFDGQEFRVWTNMLDVGAGGMSIHLNGDLRGFRSTTSPLTGTNNGRVGMGHTAQFFHGDLGEILIYDRALSAAERQQVENYLMVRWLQGGFPMSNVLPTDTNLRIGAGGVLDLNGIHQTVASLADYNGAGGTLRNVIGPPTTFTTGGGNGDDYFSGSIVDQPTRALSFAKEGTGTQTLAGGGIQYRGDTTVSGGRLMFEDAVNFGNNQPGPTAMTLSNHATVEFHVSDGNWQDVGLAGQVAVSGEGSLIKSGAGTLALGGQHSYSGDTIVTGGTLSLEAGAPAGAALWLDASADSTLTLAGGRAAQWDDRSGNDRHATAVGTGPLATSNPLALDRGVLRFGSSNSMAVDLSFLAGSEYTIFAVEGRTGAGNHYYLGTYTASSANQALHIGYRDSTTYTLAQYSNDLNIPVPAFDGQEFRVWTNMLDLGAGGQSIHLNGDLQGFRSTTSPLVGTDNGRVGTGTGTQWFNGDLGEILIFDRALGAAERQAVEAYLQAKWLTGLPQVLPAGTNLRIAGGAALELNGISQTVASLADYNGGSGTLRNTSGAPAIFTTGGGNGDDRFSGNILDQPNRALSFTKEGTGTQTLAGGGIRYRGDTTVSGGRLVFEDALNFGNNQPGPTAMTLSNNAAVEFHVGTGNRQDVGLAGQIAIGGEGSVVKSGGGTLALGGQHTYSGATIVEGGALNLEAGPVAGAALWLDASTGSSLTLDGGTVVQWADRSGNDRHAAAAGSTRPAASANPLAHDLTVVGFNGTNQILGVDLSFMAGSEYTIFAVEGRTADGNRYYLGTTPGATNQGLHVGYRTDTQYTLAQHGNDLTVNVAGYSGTQEFTVWTNMLDLGVGQTTIHRNGLLLGTRANTTPMLTADNGRVGSGHGSQWFHGDLGEIVIFDRALTTVERQAVEAYLQAKWLTGALPENVLPADTDLRIAGGAALSLGGISQTVASLADHGGSGGVITNGGPFAATLTIAGGAATEFSGTLADGPWGKSLALAHSGSGSLTLTGDNTYSGTTTVTGGTLLVNGTHTGGGLYTVRDGGTLGGMGIIAATVSIDAGGAHSPGASVGQQTVGDAVWNPGGAFQFEINNAAGDAGGPSGWDLLAVSNVYGAGTLDISGLTAGSFRIDILSLAGESPGPITDFNPTVPYTWEFVTYDTLLGEFDPGLFVLDASDFMEHNVMGTGHFTILQTDTGLAIGFIPEPGTLLMALIGLAALLTRRFRNQNPCS